MIIDILIVLIPILIIFYIILMITYHVKQKKQVNELLELFKTYGEIEKSDKNYFFKTNQDTYQIIFFHVALHAEFTINSKVIWEVKQGAQSKLFNQADLLCTKCKKIVIALPTTQKIKRYINENELVFVKYSEMFDQMFVCRKDEVKLLLETKDIL